MTASPVYWLVLHPDVPKPIGGVKQMHRLAEFIQKSGRQSIIVQDEASFHPAWFESNVNTISRKEFIKRSSSLDKSSNFLVFPETYLPAVSEYAPGFKNIIFNQNSSYTFGQPSAPFFRGEMSRVFDLYHSPLISHVLCVSQYDRDFLLDFIGLPENNVSLLVNGIEDNVSLSGSVKKSKIISYMPRKNYFDSEIVCTSLRRYFSHAGWKLMPIASCSHDQVIESLRKSLIFLSFGHPEGFGLPVAEAMACGCAVVGYSGLGGKELFDLSSQFGLGFEVAFGDWKQFLPSVSQLVSHIDNNSDQFKNSLVSMSLQTSRVYSMNNMYRSVQMFLNSFESSL
ncbi:glycosyltransferase [Synechococcus sp. YX-04-1]|uniref:glycosyltransferase n=1 Tax=Synechococcus sp. YX-04-1 TaxID=3062778 RepID=UPI0026E124AF|nr:glycosyltransferase [Synechococcus sp. YX-04-1]MDO6351163.1 glycosyltransferase [Synechococcus sp. YX-04-1]